MNVICQVMIDIKKLILNLIELKLNIHINIRIWSVSVVCLVSKV